MMPYRAEIDGLRGLAILLVVGFHTGLGTPGGFFGVDVFLVISGFLITSLLQREMASGSFTLWGFWERRARRILPASLAVSASVLLAASILSLPRDFDSVARSVAAQSIFSGNVYFSRHVGYFDDPATEQPMLHTWSLAVEEQFYFLLPMTLLALSPLLRRDRRWAAIMPLATLLAASLAWNLYLHNSGDATRAFYLLPSRAWELLLGVVLALVLATRGAVDYPRAVREFVGVAGLVLILAMGVLYDRVPRAATLVPCAGAVGVIWATSLGPTIVGRVLAWRPLVFVGLISYSLYLWHWPVLAFLTYRSTASVTVADRLSAIAVSLLLAAASWWAIEQPFRRRIVCTSRRSMFVFAGVASLAVGTSAAVTAAADGFPSRVPPAAERYMDAKRDAVALVESTHRDVEEGRLLQLGDPSSARLTALLWGDSHARVVAPALDALLQERRETGRAALHSETAPMIGYVSNGVHSLRDAVPFNAEVLRYIERHRIANVFLVAHWPGYSTPGVEPAPEESALLATVKGVVASGATAWVLTSVPAYSFDVPKALALASMSGRSIEELTSPVDGFDGIFRHGDGLRQRVIDLGGQIIDPRPNLVSGSRYRLTAGDTSLYLDRNHLTATGSKLIWLPLLRDRVPVGRVPLSER